ncbi:MAG: hypothetical protein AAF198_13005 [Pseudomonadota bacterium]
MNVPDYAVLLVQITAFFLVASVSALTTYGTLNSKFSNAREPYIAWSIGLFSLAWLVIVLVTSYSNVLVPQMDDVVPYLGVFIAGSTILVAALVLYIPNMRQIMNSVPISWFAGIQIYRVIGAVFLLLEADGLLSKYFAVTTAWGDIFVGLTAPIVAVLLHRDLYKYLWVGILWSLIGIGDLILVLFKAIQSAPGPRQTTAFDIPTEVVTYFPFSILPMLIVPVSIILHLILIQKLLAVRNNDAPKKAPVTSK